MSTNPQTRSGMRPGRPEASPRRQRGGNANRRITGVRRREQTDRVPQTTRERFRHYLQFALVPNLALALGAVAVCLAVILICGWRLAYLPSAVGETWFVLHGVPLRIDGVTLTNMPLLPPLAVTGIVATQVRKATAKRVSILDLLALLTLILALPLVLSLIALFMVYDASAVFPVETPNVAVALASPLVVHIVGFVLGIKPVVWSALAARADVPKGVVGAAQAAGKLVVRLAVAAAVVYLVALAAGYHRVGELADQFPQLGAGGKAGLAGVSLLYLPNAVVAQLAVLLGGAFTCGGGSANLFALTNVAYPPLPLFAAIPVELPGWAPVLLVVPAAVILHALLTAPLPLRDTVAAATWAALVGALLGVFASGTAGAYGLVGTDPFVLAMLLFIWVAAIGALARGVALLRQRATRGRGDYTDAGE